MARLKLGLIGGGERSQIGPARRLGARLDGPFDFVADALDHRPDAGRDYGRRLGLAADRAYGDWREMLEGERNRADRVDLVTVVTPNATHFEITRSSLRRVSTRCAKSRRRQPSRRRQDRRPRARDGPHLRGELRPRRLFAGAPHARDGRPGELGAVRMVVAAFAHGHHADADNPRVRRRCDPAQAGVSAHFADCGIHAPHMASFVIDHQVARLSAETVSCLTPWALEDDAQVNLRFDGGAIARLRTSSIAIGRQHRLTLLVFGEITAEALQDLTAGGQEPAEVEGSLGGTV